MFQLLQDANAAQRIDSAEVMCRPESTVDAEGWEMHAVV
jgi:hypothetical protein